MRAKRRRERQEKEHEKRRIETDRRQQERAFRQTVQQISEALDEKEERVVKKIEDIVAEQGIDTSLGFLQETQQIEAQGGMLLADGSRRRTPGGVFFYLVKQHQKTQKQSAGESVAV